MALFKILKGSSSALGQQNNSTYQANEGYAYFTQDDGKFYIDIADASQAVLGVNRIALNAAAADYVSGTDVHGRNLIWNTLFKDNDNLPNLNGIYHFTPASKCALTASDTHGLILTETAVCQPSLYLGSSSNTANENQIKINDLDSLTVDTEYTLSFDLSYKLLSGTSNSTTYYIYLNLYTDSATQGTFDSSALKSQAVATIPAAKKGVEVTGERVEFTFKLPTNATMCYFRLYCNRTTASNYAIGDYMQLDNIKLERGPVATYWTPAPEDYRYTITLNNHELQLGSSYNLSLNDLGATSITLNTHEITLGESYNLTATDVGAAPALHGIYYGTCDTAKATKAKVATLVNGDDFVLETGAIVIIKFAQDSTTSTMTLDVNGTGAKNLCLYSTTKMSSGTTTNGWRAGAAVPFVYDGTQWERFFWENTTYYIESIYTATAADTAEKAGVGLYDIGTSSKYFQVLVVNSNTAASALTLNINTQGAKPIYINGAPSSDTNYTLPRGYYLVHYDGTNYYFRTDDAFEITSLKSSNSDLTFEIWENDNTKNQQLNFTPTALYTTSNGTVNLGTSSNYWNNAYFKTATLTGSINRYCATNDALDPVIRVRSLNKDIKLFTVGHVANATSDYGHTYSLCYSGSKSNPNNSLDLLVGWDEENSTTNPEEIVAVSINQKREITFSNSTVTIPTTEGFKYTGIQSANTNIARAIWFGHTNGVSTPVYNNNFKYNPSTKTITIGTGSLSETDYSGTAAKATADADGNTITTTYVTKDELSGVLGNANAMVFKGTLGTGGTITEVPKKDYKAGWTYKVITAETYAGHVCEVGDLFIATADAASDQNAVNNAHWTVAQTNIDGAVTGPSSVTDGTAVLFDGTTGKVIKQGTVPIASGGTGQTTLTGARQQFSGPEFIIGTWTAASNVWTGVTTDSELYEGKQIILYMPFAGTTSSATLNLTLSDGTTTGAKNVYFEAASRFTNHKGKDSQLHLIYHENLQLSNGNTYTGWWYVANRDTTTTNATQIQFNGGIISGNSALVKSNLIVATTTGEYFHLNTGADFDITHPILYLSANVDANTATSNVYSEINFAVTTTQSMTLTAYRPVYIKGTLAGKIFTPVGAASLTQTIPSQVDNYVYIYLGYAYSTTSIRLQAAHPMFKFIDGAFKPYTGSSISNYIPIQQEYENATIIPFLMNDLAHLKQRGFSINVYSTTATDFTPLELENKTPINIDLENVFDCTQSYVSLGRPQDETTVIDLTCSTFTYGSKFYIDFGNTGWRAKKIRVLVYNSAITAGETQYTLKGSIDNLADSHFVCNTSHRAGIGFDHLRIVLSDYNSTTNRIAQIGIVGYNRPNIRLGYMSRGIDDPVWRNISPATSNTYTLGTTYMRWDAVHTNNVTTAGNILKLSAKDVDVVLGKDTDVTFGSITLTAITNNTCNLGTANTRWTTLYLNSSLFIGQQNFTAQDTANVSGVFLSPTVVSISQQSTGNNHGYKLFGNASSSYARLYISTFGTASTVDPDPEGPGTQGVQGQVWLMLGNGIARGEANTTDGAGNARGGIRIYGTGTGYTNIYSQRAGTAAENNFYLPNYDGTLYAVHAGTTSAIGNATNLPVYIAADGRVTKLSYRTVITNTTATSGVNYSGDLQTGIWYVNSISGETSTKLYNQTDGVIIANQYSSKYISEIYQDYRTGHLAVRGKNNNVWVEWKRVLDESNYDDYAIPRISTSTDHAIVRFDGLTGAVQDSLTTVDDNGCITITHQTNKNGELSIKYSTTIDYWLGVGTANKNHGLYDNKANGGAKWILWADTTNHQWRFEGTAATADALAITSSDTSKFWRGDNSWSDTLSGDTLKVTNNNNTISIGSKNESFGHIYNSANIPFAFNNTIVTTSGNLGSSGWPFNNLYLGKGEAIIYHAGTKKTLAMITFLDNTANTNGNGIAIGGGGVTIIGSGESATNFRTSTSVSADLERTYILSDNSIYLEGNGNTIANRKGIEINNSGAIIPIAAEVGTVGQQDIGSSTYYWNNVYATNFKGTADTILASLNTAQKTYLLGTTELLTDIEAGVSLTGDTGVYLTSTAGELSALRYSWHNNNKETAYTIYNDTDQSIDFIFV